MTHRRPGVTLMEVLSAAMIIVIALVGISTAVSSALRKSKTPNAIETAALLAAERLNYFRVQPDPFRAVGGTQYPFKSTDATDPNLNQAFNNNFNCRDRQGALLAGARPTLFVREYLYDMTEGADVDALGKDVRRDNQRRRTLVGSENDGSGQLYGRNQVPPTVLVPGGGPTVLGRVVSNVDGVPSANQAVPDATYAVMPAPYANSRVLGQLTADGRLPQDIKYVREVWVESNHPAFNTAGAGAPAMLGLAAGSFPNVAPYLPPYCVNVTVRVFARDTKQYTYAAVFNPNAAAGAAGPGYNPNRPLVEVTGIFGLRRLLN